jgi:CRP/FNR family cyclic AMP-dependent transcriptional regulator
MLGNGVHSGPRVGLLEADPELGRWLSPSDFVEAGRRSAVAVLVVQPGFWVPPAHAGSTSDHLGYLLMEGMLARDEQLAGCTATELLGPGELLQPWNAHPDETLLPRRVIWECLETARLAVLGPAFVAAIRPYPALTSALIDRAVRWSATLATHRAICQLNPVELRLLLLFWHLAERWGHIGADGVILPVSLQHEMLGRLAAAKRSTVTLGLQKLIATGAIERRGKGAWVLHGEPPAMLSGDPAIRSEAPVALRSAAP